MSGVTIELLQGGSVIRTTITNGNGDYSFTGVAVGSYTVRETDPPGYASTTPNDVAVSVTSGGTATANFGDRGIGTIQGVVFDDRNGNTVQNAGEPGVGGVTITLLQGGSTISTTTTTVDGSYQFASLWLGDYTVQQTNLPGYVDITPSEANISLTSPGQVETVDFSDQAQASISGMVFYDLDENGSYDAGEAGIGGVEIILAGDGSRTTNTAGDGSYAFASIPLGNYSVQETDPSGFGSTTPNSVTVPLITPGQIVTDVNFGDYGLPGDIEGTVFDDLNGNGVQNIGESGIPTVTIELLLGGGVISTTTTNINGTYSFTDVTPGGYTVRETDPAGYASTTANEVSISLPPDGLATADFGDRGIGTVSGVVFNDVNGDGVQDAGESGIINVMVQLLQGGSPISTTTTNATGVYSFTAVTEGSYTVRETDPAGYVSTTPNDVIVSVAPDGSATANFGDQGIGTVSGVVFNDVNGDGGQDAGESGIINVMVQLLQGGSPISTTTTNATGVYSFTAVTEGSYTVRETDPDGYVSTTPNDVVVSVAPGGSATANFGDQQVGTISGVAFNDLDGDGVQGAGEGGIAGVIIELWQDGSFVISETTNISGVYSFDGVTEGSYTVKATRPAGFINTTPDEVVVYVAPGGSATANFGFQQVGTVSGVVFNDANGDGVRDAGEGGIGGVVITLTTSTATFTATTAGDGSYLFSGVESGNHNVSSAGVPGFVRTTSGLVGVWVAPGGSANASFGFQGQGTVAGVAFNDLNGDGIKQAGENGIGGVVVSLMVSGEITPTDVITTTGDGSYSFSGVPAGSYDVAAAVPSGFVRTTLSLVAVSVAPGGSANANFGFQGQGTVSGMAFNDLNGDGVKQAGENGIGGVVISLVSGGTITTTTSGDGSYSFSDVPEGSYDVEAELPSGFVRTTLSPVAVSVAPGGSANASFGFQGQGTVSGEAFNDINGNGVRDGGEGGIGGVVIRLDGSEVTTAGDGSYSFSDVPEGSYTVQATAPTGFVHTTSSSVPVSVAPGGSASANFGFQGQGTVSGEAFNDANGNGVKDAGEGGIGGVVISLIGGGTITTTTSGDGSYSFSDVLEGSYMVESEVPAGFVRTTLSPVPVSVAPGGSANANFGFQGRGTVSGVAFNDLNGDGVKQTGENGIGGVVISLVGSGTITTTTSGGGSYSFDDVSEGSYDVEAAVPTGFVRTTLSPVAVSVAPGGSANANFGFQGQGTVGGVAFNDLNGDGVKQVGESGIGGVVISLMVSGETTPIDVVTTTGDGSYSFSDVPEGSYDVEAGLPTGFVRTTLSPVAVLVAPGGSASANFGFQGQGTVSGEAFNDLNGDGVKQAGEGGIGGVLITLTGRWTLTTTTSSDGSYSFANIPEGSWTVESEVPAGFAHITPGSVPVSVAPGGSAIANFGFQGQGTVGGVAFNDANGNEVRDPSEVGIGGVVITLTASVTTTTAGDGSYLFTDVPAGSYTVLAADVPGFVRTTPGSVGVSVAAGGSASANFGYQQVGTIGGVVFNDANGNGVKDPSESGIGGVVVSYDTVTATSAGDGSYLFTGVTAGNYTVSAADVPGFVRTTLGSVEVSVAGGGSGSADFGYQQVGTISGVVFNDANGDGVKDAGESGIGGVVITYDTITATTVGDGSYLFTGVTKGSYTVSAADVPGFVRTTLGSVMVWVASGGSASASFGYQQVGTIGGVVFNDTNGNGVKDPSESGIGGVVVTYDTITATSAGDGSYLFTSVTAGNYTVSAANVPGFVRTTLGSVGVSVPTGGSGSASFGYQQVGTISGQVFNDTNGDGAKGGSEVGIGGVTVTLKTGAGTTVEIVTTVGNGSYVFSEVLNGSYTVEETDPEGFTSTTSNVVPITLSAGEPSASVNFGDLPIGTVSGAVFHDLDTDGLQGWAEPGIGGVTITLSTAQGALITATRTVGNGNYEFRVSPGDYIVEETNPEGFTSTTPDRVPITVPIGGSATVNFGDRAGYPYLYLPIVMKRYPGHRIYLPLIMRGY